MTLKKKVREILWNLLDWIISKYYTAEYLEVNTRGKVIAKIKIRRK